jgi:uncharacterized protein
VLLAGAGLAVLGGMGTAVLLDRRTGPPVPRLLTLATGPQGAVFLEVGRDLARAVTAVSPGTRVTTLVTAATVENLRLLATSAADLGLASLDAAAVDPNVRRGAITAVSRIYDSLLHLVVPAGSPVQVLGDCAGRRVSVGASGSGTEFTTIRLLELAGVRPSALVRLGQAEAMDALDRGTVEAAFSLTGFPTPAIARLAARRPLRLIPLVDFATLLERSIPRVYAPAAIPQGSYAGVAAVQTVFVPNLLLARPGLPDGAVSVVTQALLSPSSRRFWTAPDSRRIDVRTAIATGPVALHEAALTWLRAHKP